MTARYRLLKGNACDFVGAPANARLAIRHRMDGRLAWCEELETHATMWEPEKKNTYFIGNKENWFLVGIREPATDDEQDLNECIGSPEADNKYLHEIKPGIFIDVYDVLMAWNVTNPALQHLIKKALQAGERGHKSHEQDLQDIIDSAIRAKELEIK